MIALRALIEGDAEMAQARHEASTSAEMTSDGARRASEQVLDELQGPAFFKAYPAFAYSYGARYVAGRLEVRAGHWNVRNVDAMSRAGGPKTAQEVMREPEANALAPAAVGLSRLPSELASYDVETVLEVFGLDAVTGEQVPRARPHRVEPARAVAQVRMDVGVNGAARRDHDGRGAATYGVCAERRARRHRSEPREIGIRERPAAASA